jgi:glycosyltransferase involved in cell wall biosynthesis
MDITFVSFDMSHNCLSRPYLLAEILSKDYEVEIIGPELGDGIWDPVSEEYDYRTVSSGYFAHHQLRSIRSLSKMIEGDIIYACKPRATSFGVGLLNRWHSNKPLILDIEDWDSGLATKSSPVKTAVYNLKDLGDLNSFYYTRLLEQLTNRADATTVSNRFLQKKFDGEIIRHVRDINQFSPNRFSNEDLREEFDLPKSEKLVVFAGTPDRHKGVLELVEAANSIDRDDFRVVIVGASDTRYMDQVRSKANSKTIIRGRQPFQDMPKWNAVADIIAVPQLKDKRTQGQIPAKIFDAMALGKPILTTEVSDIPEIVDDTAVVVQPNSVKALTSGLKRLLNDPLLRAQLGDRARQRCLQKYSYEAVRPVLNPIIDQFL